MEVLIKDLCKEKKDSLNLTNQNIADRANLSASTVNNYFQNHPRPRLSIQLVRSARLSVYRLTVTSGSSPKKNRIGMRIT